MNISTLFRRNAEHPSLSRIGLALRSAAKSNYPQDRTPFGRRRYRPDIAGSDRLFFNVRSFGSLGRDHVLQYAFVDDHGNVMLSAFVRAAAPGALLLGAWPGDLATGPLDEARFDDVAAMLCPGATLVAYQRVLQGASAPGRRGLGGEP